MNLDKRLEGATIIASVSGGKDSAAMTLYLQRELKLTNVVRVFADTKWEYKEEDASREDTYKYLRGPLTQALGPIVEVSNQHGGMADLIRRHKMFPSRLRKYCTKELKIIPIRDYIRSLDTLVVNAVGIRRQESEKRKDFTEWEWHDEFDCWTWRPIIDWSEADVIAIHQRHGLRPNPLYLDGAKRVGCWPCIFARKSEIRMVADRSPDRIAEIRQLEAELPENPATPEVLVYDDDGEAIGVKEARPPMPRTYFHGLLSREGIPVPIDEAVRWSRTVHGSREQGALFYDLGEPEGCVRWGMCEPQPAEDP